MLAADLELATTAAIAGKVLGYTVVNIGALPIMLGEAHKLERFTDDGWERSKSLTCFRCGGGVWNQGIASS